MNLLIDIGNTRAKWTVYNGDKEVQSGVDDYTLLKWEHLQAAIICNTGNLDHPLAITALETIDHTLVLDQNTSVPFINEYMSTATLGRDRIALVSGAQALYPGENCLIIGCGTCMTYDYINANGVYIGGNISPGLDMRFEAMHRMTDKLPLVKRAHHHHPLGTSTEEALQNGAVLGLIDEMNGLINRIEKRYINFKTILKSWVHTSYCIAKLYSKYSPVNCAKSHKYLKSKSTIPSSSDTKVITMEKYLIPGTQMEKDACLLTPQYIYYYTILLSTSILDI